VAKKCLNVRYYCPESVLWAGIEKYTIIMKTFTVCATGVTIVLVTISHSA
jgi:hypothetical protein